MRWRGRGGEENRRGDWDYLHTYNVLLEKGRTGLIPCVLCTAYRLEFRCEIWAVFAFLSSIFRAVSKK